MRCFENKVVGAHVLLRAGAVGERRQLVMKPTWVGCATLKYKADSQPGAMKVKRENAVVEWKTYTEDALHLKLICSVVLTGLPAVVDLRPAQKVWWRRKLVGVVVEAVVGVLWKAYELSKLK